MKRSQILAVSVVALIFLAAIPVQVAQAQGGYTEKLSVYIAGSSALWYFTYSGLNGSSKLSALESTPGLSWYNVTAIKTTGWASDFEIFGPTGYDLLPVPFIPSQGLFLTVGSDSYADASAAAQALGSFMLTSFVSQSNASGTYSFYSPLSFSTLVPATLFKFYPTALHGFADAVTSSTFASAASPFVVLEGQRTSTGFSHSLVVGSISGSALDSTNRPNVLSYFGGSVSTLQSSNKSTSSMIQITALDGILESSDSAVVSNNGARFTGTYTLTLAHGKDVSSFNATVVQQPVPLLATRAVDVGVLHTGDDLAVTLSLKNLSPTDTITRLSFTDNWWNSTGDFKFLGGNDSVSGTGLSSLASVTAVYRLQYTGTSTGSFTIPPSVVRFTYQVGARTFNGTSTLNPIRLSLGTDDAVIFAIVTPLGSAGSVGTSQKVNVTLTNVGTLPALSVAIGGHSIPGGGLAAKSLGSVGGSASVTLTLTATALLGINQTQLFSASYQDPAGNNLNATTNVLPVVFSHSSLKLGYPTLTVSAQLATLSNLQTNLTLTFSTTNLGPENITSFTASGALPSGLGCGDISGNGLTCSGGSISISYPLINATSNLSAYMKYNLTSPANYYLAPFQFSGQTMGTTARGTSNPTAVPAGVVLSKVFSPAQLFGGMTSRVTIAATNQGPLQIYNATVSTTVDSFDTISGTSTLTKGPALLASGGNITLSYNVTIASTSGNLTANPVTASFYFGGASFSTEGVGLALQVYRPISVSISTSPVTPEEGKTFTINFQVSNPSGVAVSNILFTLPVPSGLSLSNLQNAEVSAGSITISASTLASHAVLTANMSAVASSGIVVPFDKAKVTFTYGGTTINGVLSSKTGIAIAEDVTTRYLIPIGIIIVALLATAFYLRKLAAPTVPSSPK